MSRATDPHIRVDRDGSIATITLDRPEAGNAITLDMARALVAASIDCDADDSIRCVVLTGMGRMFCAGGDIASFADAGDHRSAFLNELAGTVHMALSRFARMRKPLLVLVNGPAAGAGLSMALLGDVVLAVRSAHFTTAYGAIGLTPDGGMTWLLPRLVGLRKAQDMLITNRRVLAPEAEAIGIVTRLVDDDALAIDGQALAAQLAVGATAAIAGARALLLESFDSGLETQMERETRAISVAGGGIECREGIAAFRDKRKPDFQGA